MKKAVKTLCCSEVRQFELNPPLTNSSDLLRCFANLALAVPTQVAEWMPCKLQDIIKKLTLGETQEHFAVTDLKKAKFPVKDLVAKGYTSKQLVVFDSYTLSDLKVAGVGLRTLAEEGWGKSDLLAAGFPQERVISEIDARERMEAARLRAQLSAPSEGKSKPLILREARTYTAVSYTHLTLPTILLV